VAGQTLIAGATRRLAPAACWGLRAATSATSTGRPQKAPGAPKKHRALAWWPAKRRSPAPPAGLRRRLLGIGRRNQHRAPQPAPGAATSTARRNQHRAPQPAPGASPVAALPPPPQSTGRQPGGWNPTPVAWAVSIASTGRRPL